MTVPGSGRLRQVVDLARRAPSVHNTQPWRWRQVEGSTLELLADRSRQLRVADPVGRNLTLSCGAAVHHAVTAGLALGLGCHVELLPDRSRVDLLARLDLEAHPAPPDAEERLRLLELRSTDRRRFTAWPVPLARLRDLGAVAARWGASALPVVTTDGRLRAEGLLERARQAQELDDALVEEQRHWVDHSPSDGIPQLVAAPLRTPRAEPPDRFRDDDPTGGSSSPVRSTDGLLVLCTADDDVLAWLRAGQALSAVWFEATRAGLSLVPLSQVVEVPETRRDLRRDVLADAAHHQLLLRIGWQEIGRASLVRTPRRPLDDVLV